jgi:hypothetical protein
LAILILGGLTLLRTQFSGAGNSSEQAESVRNSRTKSRVSNRATGQASAPGTRINRTSREFETKRELVRRGTGETSVPVGEVNPEQQPRAFMTTDFRDLAGLPTGFKLENVELTADGFQLKPAAAGAENDPRMGTIESAPQIFDFQSNAVTPMWKENLPDQTDMFIEVSVSPDGQNWGAWQWIDVDEDSVGQIAEFYPDGTPNPNYGYIPGSTMVWGLTQYQYVRYRIQLYSETGESPTLGAFRFYYQDSTLGEGHLATPGSMAQSSQGVPVP